MGVAAPRASVGRPTGWAVRVHDPLKSLVMGPSLLDNCCILKTSFTINQGERPLNN